MKHGELTFEDFKKFMKFLGVWTEYQKELKRNETTVADVQEIYDSRDFIWRSVDDFTSKRGYAFWDSVNNMWWSYNRFKKIKRLK